MDRSTFLRRAGRRLKFPVQICHLNYAIRAGVIAPPKMTCGLRDYRDEDLNVFVEYMRKRSRSYGLAKAGAVGA